MLANEARAHVMAARHHRLTAARLPRCSEYTRPRGLACIPLLTSCRLRCLPVTLRLAHVQAVTYDASEEAGCAAGCINNTRAAIAQIFRLSQALAGRQTLQQALRLCDELPSGSADDVAYWVQVTIAVSPAYNLLAIERCAPCALRDHHICLRNAQPCQSNTAGSVLLAVSHGWKHIHACMLACIYMLRLLACACPMNDLVPQGAFDSFAMGNYPFPTYYIGGSAEHPLPAFPMREACSHLGGSFETDQDLLQV